MREDNNMENQKDEEMITIPLLRHLSQEEVEVRKAQGQTKKWKKRAILVSVFCLLLGFCLGNIVHLSAFGKLRNLYQNAVGVSSTEKEAAILDILENSWYFSKDIDDLDTRLRDQAIVGMTTNSEDIHTSYMSKDQSESFVQSINRNYVGIGVQYIMYNSYPIVTKVFHQSPASKSGMQAGDVIQAVDGKDIYGYSSDQIKENIMGEEGTDVTLSVVRGDETIEIVVKRGQVNATTYAYLLTDDTIYLQLYQFGESTSQDVKAYLDELIGNKEKVSLVLDLRGNGGGYLTSVQALASYFIETGDTVLIQEFTDGSKNTVAASGEKYNQIQDIVILVDQDTASAAEVMTLALQQNRDDVTVVGVTTYGKGTVQTSTYFSDGSALKYTTSRWLSPNGDWINQVGITPDEVVELPAALTQSFSSMEKADVYEEDIVSDVVASVQRVLAYFGYAVDRQDGYFSKQTQAQWIAFNQDRDFACDGTITYDSYMRALSEVMYDWATSSEHDTQLAKAKEILHG